MKKLLCFLLVLTILSAALSGCGNKKEIEFGAKVHHFLGLAMDNANDIMSLCAVEYEQLRDDGIGAEEQDDDYFDKCAARFRKETGTNLDLLVQRCEEIDQEYQEIINMDVEAENAGTLKNAVKRLYQAHQKLLARSTVIYGPAEDFLNECSEYFSDASKANSDAIDLLQPYYQKPGFAKLIN